MNIQKKYAIAGMLVPAAVVLSLVVPAFAQAATATHTKTHAAATPATLIARADTEIGNRIADLTSLSARINAATHVSTTAKASLSASMLSDITAMNNLKAKIDADTTTAELKTDMATITANYRIYALVAPQTRILIAADQEATVADMITALNAKLSTRIASATSAGDDMTAITAAETDLVAKLADSNLQTSTAITNVSPLVPDNGNATILASNTAALVKARADIRVSQSDLQSANKDVKAIVAALESYGDASTTATSTATTSAAVTQ